MELEELKEKTKLVEVSEHNSAAQKLSPTEEPSEAQPVSADSVQTGDENFDDDDDSDDDSSDAYDDCEMIGKTVGGHYEILSKIGSGGMSTVFKAKHMLLDKFVAIKFIRQKLIYDKQTAKRFRQEARASTELHHENICAVKEFEIHAENRPFLVMDYLEGRSLTDVIANEGPLDPHRALAIAAEICSGLSHAHSKKVIHRDVKPGNIVLVEDGRGAESVRIVDFGLAKLLRQEQSGPNLTQTGEIFGTPNYMSPEQCVGKPVDARTDIYSLGCLLHEMVHGKPPFEASSNIEVIMKHVGESPALKSSNPVNRLILKCLEKSPDCRYSSVDSLLADINSIRANKIFVHARPGKSNVQRYVVVGLLLLLVCATLTTLEGLSKNESSWMQTKHQWRAETNNANQMIEQNRLTDAEASLNRALKIAEDSGSSELKSAALNNLSTLEFNLGKWEQARNHTQLAEQAPPKNDAKHMQVTGLMVACTFVLMGLGIFIFFLLAVSPVHDPIYLRKIRDLYKKNMVDLGER